MELTKNIQEIIDKAWENKTEICFDIDAMIVYESLEDANNDGVWLCKILDPKEFNKKEGFEKAVRFILKNY